MTLGEKLIALFIWTLAMIGVGFVAGTWVKDSIAIRAQQASQQGAAAEIAKLKPQNTVVNQKIVERIRTEKVYTECRHSPDAFQTILEAYRK